MKDQKRAIFLLLIGGLSLLSKGAFATTEDCASHLSEASLILSMGDSAIAIRESKVKDTRGSEEAFFERLMLYSADPQALLPTLENQRLLRQFEYLKSADLNTDQVKRIGSWAEEKHKEKSKVSAISKLLGASGIFDQMKPVSVEFVAFKPGKFMMGSPYAEEDRFDDETLHEVEISYSFEVAKTTETQVQWFAVMRTNPSAYTKGGTIAGSTTIAVNQPVTRTTFWSKLVYCNRVSEAAGLAPAYDLSRLTEVSGNAEDGTLVMSGEVRFNNPENDVSKTEGFRLATEAEWERAARSGGHVRAAYPSGEDTADNLGKYAHRGRNPIDVASLQANEAGLFDMSGNVWEQVFDLYGPYEAKAKNPVTSPNPNGTSRVLRGGPWGVHPRYLRSAKRVGYGPGVAYSDVSFRLVRTIP